jgi:hypothetical protein
VIPPASAGRRARLLALVLGLGAAPSVLAQSLPFTGRWLLDDRPDAQAPYLILTIKDDSMSWSGPDKSAPRCMQQFVLKKESPGSVYLDGRGVKFVAGTKGSLPTYLLTLRSSSCGRVGEDVRISYPLVYDTGHIEVIEYVNGKPLGSRRFRRRK